MSLYILFQMALYIVSFNYAFKILFLQDTHFLYSAKYFYLFLLTKIDSANIRVESLQNSNV